MTLIMFFIFKRYLKNKSFFKLSIRSLQAAQLYDLKRNRAELTKELVYKKNLLGFLSLFVCLDSFLMTQQLFFSLLVTLMTFYYVDLRIIEKKKTNVHLIEMIRVRLVMKLALLMTCGVTGLQAIKEVCESENDLISSYISNELTAFHNQVDLYKVVITISDRLQDIYITRALRIIIIDAHYGHSESSSMMKNLYDELRIASRTDVIKHSEILSQKLLIPMSISLLAITLALTYPAIYEIVTIF